jgi:outer membrane protein TolC
MSRRALVAILLLLTAEAAGAQMSLSSAVDLAVRSHPKVLSAEADLERARTALKQARDVYIPAIAAGAGLGQAYGYSTNPPTLFSISAGSLVYNPSQMSYIRSARAGLEAAELALEEARAGVAQDTALAVVALQHDQQREDAIRQESDYASALENIVQQRLNAGQDTQISLTQARLSTAQFRLALLRAQDDTANDRGRLARMLDVPETALIVDKEFPGTPLPDESAPPHTEKYASAGVASAFANAEARRHEAVGDATFLYRPQINMFGQYNRYATFSNSYKQLQQVYLDPVTNKSRLTANEWFFGIQLSVPIVDFLHRDKGRESSAVASKALHDAENAQLDALDGEARSSHAIRELQAQVEVAGLQQQLSQQQLDVVLLQLQNGTGNPDAPQLTPKDEQNARIAERERFLSVVDANFQLRQAEIQLLRQTGQLLTWLQNARAVPPQSGPPPAAAVRP